MAALPIWSWILIASVTVIVVTIAIVVPILVRNRKRKTTEESDVSEESKESEPDVVPPSGACASIMSDQTWDFETFENFEGNGPIVRALPSGDEQFSMVFRLRIDTDAMYPSTNDEFAKYGAIDRSALARIQSTVEGDFMVIRFGSCEVTRGGVIRDAKTYRSFNDLPEEDDTDFANYDDVRTGYFLFQCSRYDAVGTTPGGTRLKMTWFKKKTDGSYEDVISTYDFVNDPRDIGGWFPTFESVSLNTELQATLSNGFTSVQANGSDLDNTFFYARLFKGQVFDNPTQQELACLFDDGGGTQL